MRPGVCGLGHGSGVSINLRNHIGRENRAGISIVGPLGQIRLSESDIFDNLVFNLEIQGIRGRDVEADRNWWGTVSMPFLADKIQNQNDSADLSKVVFAPVATARINASP
jgi:hypothetical protein